MNPIMNPIIIANWKMTIELNDAITLAQKFESFNHSSQLFLAPPTPYLAYLAKILVKTKLCAQDISSIKELGAYTGENSATIIKSCGVHHSIIGHSERRTTQRESNSLVRKKVENCIEAGIAPIVCIGETLESRKNKNYTEFLIEQINSSLPSNAHNLIIAYEPVWAIGSGITPHPEEIHEIVELIKKSARVELVAKNAQLVYGGSVSSKNFAEIIRVPGLSGVLMGSASIDESEMTSILNQK
ncbi:MAG: triose-phosphate isomerase [Rickettsiaceae bacterium]|nr:triose-phosphate isomerase [Rickettsiaceae bacterium]